jgi:hypothetical protein
LYGLGINVTARFDVSEQVKVCERLRDDFMRGALAHDTVYFLPAAAAADLQRRLTLGLSVTCP